MRTPDRGMTLIEVLMALAVLIIGLAAETSTVIYASRATSTGAHVEVASTQAQSLLTTLLAMPYDARTTSATSVFANVTTANDADVADSAHNFELATLTANSYDHVDTELKPEALAMVAPLPSTADVPYQRYWNIAPIGTTGVTIAVIVRWQEAGVWKRTVVVGTRFSPP
jgi:prepilin-type N-terminal cleavage/methylation domain-containing protein